MIGTTLPITQSKKRKKILSVTWKLKKFYIILNIK
jgi:hypothetical protein